AEIRQRRIHAEQPSRESGCDVFRSRRRAYYTAGKQVLVRQDDDSTDALQALLLSDAPVVELNLQIAELSCAPREPDGPRVGLLRPQVRIAAGDRIEEDDLIVACRIARLGRHGHSGLLDGVKRRGAIARPIGGSYEQVREQAPLESKLRIEGVAEVAVIVVASGRRQRQSLHG